MAKDIEGDYRNDKSEGKGIYYKIMVIDMMEILEMIKLKEKVYIILMKNLLKVIYMKVIGKMIKKKEKEFIILIMAKDMMVILKMIKKKEKEFIILIMAI